MYKGEISVKVQSTARRITVRIASIFENRLLSTRCTSYKGEHLEILTVLTALRVEHYLNSENVSIIKIDISRNDDFGSGHVDIRPL